MRKFIYVFLKKLDRWDDKHPILLRIIVLIIFYILAILGFIFKVYLSATFLMLFAIILTIITIHIKRNRH